MKKKKRAGNGTNDPVHMPLPPASWRAAACGLLMPVLLGSGAGNIQAKSIPKGFILPASTRSPDGRYGVTVPLLSAR